MRHFNNRISKDIRDYATDEVFLDSRYLFIRREGKRQYAYCTHCHKEFDSTDLNLKHQREYRQYEYCSAGLMSRPLEKMMPVTCPKCGSSCKVKSGGISRKYMADASYFMYFDKSKIDPKVVVARGFMGYRNYSGDYHNVQTQYLEISRYIFKMGGSKNVCNCRILLG